MEAWKFTVDRMRLGVVDYTSALCVNQKERGGGCFAGGLKIRKKNRKKGCIVAHRSSFHCCRLCWPRRIARISWRSIWKLGDSSKMQHLNESRRKRKVEPWYDRLALFDLWEFYWKYFFYSNVLENLGKKGFSRWKKYIFSGTLAYRCFPITIIGILVVLIIFLPLINPEKVDHGRRGAVPSTCDNKCRYFSPQRYSLLPQSQKPHYLLNSCLNAHWIQWDELFLTRRRFTALVHEQSEFFIMKIFQVH